MGFNSGFKGLTFGFREVSNSYTGLDRPFGLQQVEAPGIYRHLSHEGVSYVKEV